MKQFLIVLLAAAAIVAGWMFYRGADAPTPQRERPRLRGPQHQQPARPRVGNKRIVQTPEGPTEIEVYVPDDIREKQREAAQRIMASASYSDLVEESSLVRLEDGWAMDFSGVDFDAEVLVSFETESGARAEVTKADWDRYLCLTFLEPLIRSKLFAAKAAAIAERFGVEHRFTDDQWTAYFAAEAAAREMTVEKYRKVLSSSYLTRPEAAEEIRRNAVESMIAFYPPVADAEAFPALMRGAVEDDEDVRMQREIAGQIAEACKDLGDPENVKALVGISSFGQLFFTRNQPVFTFYGTWSFLDGGLPDDAVAAAALAEIPVGGEPMAPWLVPGPVYTCPTAEVLPHVPDMPREAKELMLRELAWLEVLRAELAASGSVTTPEDLWRIHQVEFEQQRSSPLGMVGFVTKIAGYPTPYHYRAFSGTMWSYASSQPDDWDGEERLREHYAKNRVFAEAWTPAMEIISFPALRGGDGLVTDWESALQEAQEAREQIVSGEVEFSTLRARRHVVLMDELVEAGLEEEAQVADYLLRSGLLADRMPQAERGLGETAYSQLLNCTSLVRNAVVRLDRGEPSPVWRTPTGYVLLRILDVTAADLEGEFEDFEEQTRFDYTRSEFSAWANEVLAGTELGS